MSVNNDRVSVRDHMVAIAANGRPVFETVKSLGVKAIELQVDLDLSTPHARKADGSTFSIESNETLDALQHALAADGIHVSALLLGTDFSSDQPDRQVAWAVKAMQAAQRLGALVVRVDPLTRNRELSATAVRDHFVRNIKEVLRQTTESGIDLGIENHGPVGNDPKFLDEVFAAVNDSRLGMTLDTGNFYWWGVPLDELYRLLERYASRTRHTHMKNINYPANLANVQRPIGTDYGKYCCPLDEGNIELSRVVSILNNAGYTRDFCIENEALNKYPAEAQLDVLKRDVTAVRQAMGRS